MRDIFSALKNYIKQKFNSVGESGAHWDSAWHTMGHNKIYTHFNAKLKLNLRCLPTRANPLCKIVSGSLNTMSTAFMNDESSTLGKTNDSTVGFSFLRKLTCIPFLSVSIVSGPFC